MGIKLSTIPFVPAIQVSRQKSDFPDELCPCVDLDGGGDGSIEIGGQVVYAAGRSLLFFQGVLAAREVTIPLLKSLEAVRLVVPSIRMAGQNVPLP